MAWEAPFLDGFDHVASADVPSKWDHAPNTGSYFIQSTVARNGGKALNVGANTYMVKFTPDRRNFCVGMAYHQYGVPGATIGSSGVVLFSLTNDPSGSAFTTQISLVILNDNKFRIVRSTQAYTGGVFGSVATLATGTYVLLQNAFVYIEFKVFLDDSVGTAELKINGVVDATFTGDTVAQSYNTANRVIVMSPASCYMDDIYIRTGTSSSAESGGYLGDVSVKSYYPNADGTYTAMTCSTGSTHNTLVDETTPNTSDYVSSAVALTKDSYGFQDVSGSGAIMAVQLNAYTSKNDAGFRGLDLFCRSSSTENFGASYPLSTNWRYQLQGWVTDPNTGSAWTVANFNAAEFGVRVSADL
jgi:hypothetical protein